MNTDQQNQFDDLKQFIEATVSQSEMRITAQIDEKIGVVDAKIDSLDKKIDNKIDQLREEMLDGFTGVGEAIDGINDRLDVTDKVVDQRLTKLEQQIQAA